MTKKPRRQYAAPGNGQQKGNKRGPAAKLDLQNAYAAVFQGTPSEIQRDMVLVDLATFSGFYSVAPEGANLSRHEGARSVYGRIHSFLTMTDAEKTAFEVTVRDAHFVDSFEGEL